MSSDESDTKTRILSQAWRLLEQKRGQGVRLEDVARAVGISRQAIYLHFPSRAELLIATARYVDQIHGLDQRRHFLVRQPPAQCSGVFLCLAGVFGPGIGTAPLQFSQFNATCDGLLQPCACPVSRMI